MSAGALLAAVGLWLLICAFCGYRRQLRQFVIVLVCGVTLGVIGLMAALGVRVDDPALWKAGVSAVSLALARGGCGWWIARALHRTGS